MKKSNIINFKEKRLNLFIKRLSEEYCFSEAEVYVAIGIFIANNDRLSYADAKNYFEIILIQRGSYYDEY